MPTSAAYLGSSSMYRLKLTHTTSLHVPRLSVAWPRMAESTYFEQPNQVLYRHFQRMMGQMLELAACKHYHDVLRPGSLHSTCCFDNMSSACFRSSALAINHLSHKSTIRLVFIENLSNLGNLTFTTLQNFASYTYHIHQFNYLPIQRAVHVVPRCGGFFQSSSVVS